jgi:hypothetical protein
MLFPAKSRVVVRYKNSRFSTLVGSVAALPILFQNRLYLFEFLPCIGGG